MTTSTATPTPVTGRWAVILGASSGFGDAAIPVWREQLNDVRHPVVRNHPETGRPTLYCVSTSTPIVGMSADESDAILGVLQRHAANPNFTCRWRWTTGDVVVWDERCTSHFAVRDPWDGPRSMRRVLVEGDVPIPTTHREVGG